ncbi:MAG: tetratricopeptide repeat protein, partial [Litorivicinus sp.]
MKTANDTLKDAHQLISQRDFTGALKLLDKPSYPPSAQRAVAALRSLAFAMSGNKENAISELEAFQSPDETDKADTLFAAGSAAFKLGFAAPAARLLRGALELAPEHPLVNARLGGAYLSLGNYEAAAPCLEKAADLMPESGGAQLNLAHLRMQRNELELALEHLNRAENLPDSEPDVLITLRSDVLKKLGREDELLQLLREQVGEGDTTAIKRLVELLCSTGAHDEARMYIRQGLERSADNIELLTMAAEISQTQGRSTEASHYLKRALEIEPENAAIWRRQAAVNARRLDKDLALNAAKQAIELTKDASPAALAKSKATYALVLGELGDLETSEMEYREALTLHGSCIQALRGLGQVLLQVGRLDEANELFNKLVTIAPVQGWAQLISARQVPDDESVLEKME